MYALLLQAKLAAMEEQSRLELAEYEAERRRTEERLEKRNNEAAVRIQAHFKGMRSVISFLTFCKIFPKACGYCFGCIFDTCGY